MAFDDEFGSATPGDTYEAGRDLQGDDTPERFPRDAEIKTSEEAGQLARRVFVCSICLGHRYPTRTSAPRVISPVQNTSIF